MPVRCGVSALALPLLLAGCFGEVGVEEEAELGAEAAAQIQEEVPLVHDPVAVGELNRIGDALVEHADSTGRDYTFYIVDAPEVNAFAIPGGHIFVNRGLIEQADELAELAGVLGHEIAHVTERHGLEQAEKARGANILMTLFYLVTGGQVGILEQVVIQGGASAVFAKYGRDAEREADREAVTTLVRAGYHPEGMATFFEELMRAQQRNPSRFEQWFASHPTSAERIENARAVIRAFGPLEERDLVRDTPEYQALRARLAGRPTGAGANRQW